MVGIGIDIGTSFFFFLLLLMESLDDGMDQVYDGHAGHVEAFVFLTQIDARWVRVEFLASFAIVVFGEG